MDSYNFPNPDRVYNPLHPDEEDLEIMNWETEANGIIKDIEKHCLDVGVSSLEADQVHISLTTLEDEQFLIKLNKDGFRIITSEETGDELVFETSEFF